LAHDGYARLAANYYLAFVKLTAIRIWLPAQDAKKPGLLAETGPFHLLNG